QFEATRVLPTLGRLTPAPAACAIDPDHLASASTGDLPIFEKLFAEKPCRIAGQPRSEPGLVTWAGDRAYFLSGNRLRSAARTDGAARDEPPPLHGRRARLA